MGPLHALTAEFQAKLGRALTRWQYVETGLFVLAHALMETRYEVSSTVFFHIKSAENKLSLVDKLCRLNLSQQVWQGEWRDLRKELSAHIDIRNALAHFEVMFVDRPVSTGGTRIELGLVTHHLDIYSARGGTDKGLYLDQLDQAADEFLTYSKELIRFSIKNVSDWQRRVEQLPQGLQQVLETIRSEANSPAPPPPPEPSPK